VSDHRDQLYQFCRERFPALRIRGIRAGFLFVNFLLIITALYQLKPSSRSLFIEYLGADSLPYVWICTAVVMGGVITIYHKLVEHVSRIRLVLGSCFLFGGMLIVFRLWLIRPDPVAAVAFYIFVDILGVVLVEQFWSLTNAIYSTREGKSWYGFIGTGGLLGGVIGGSFAGLLLSYTPLQTPDLLTVAACLLGIILLVSMLMSRIGLYCEAEGTEQAVVSKDGWKAITKNRYLILIAAILLLAQFASPVIEYQFLKTVEHAYPELEQRTAFLSYFFSLLGLVSIGVNLGFTPLIHRTLGVIAGLLVQPILITICAFGFLANPTLLLSAAAKISDRGLSYSINRASRELLYVPIDTVLIYRAKAWIDMFGYRLFKIFGSVLILLFTDWLPVSIGIPRLSWLVAGICLLWFVVILQIRVEYGLIAPRDNK
jgi:AAA family ATP:ADP antiporter